MTGAQISERDGQLRRALGCLRHRPAGRAGADDPPGAADDALGPGGDDRGRAPVRGGPAAAADVLFAAWTGEERGLLGSEYYAQHPLFPMETMVGEPDLRHAAMGRAGEGRGAGRQGQSEMERYLEEAARRRAATSLPRTIPSAGCSIAPIISPSPSAAFRCCSIWRWPGPTTWSMAAARRGSAGSMSFTANCYHQPCDAWCAELEPARRGAGGGAVLCHRCAAREQPRMAAMERDSEFAGVRAKSAAARSRPGGRPERGR